MAKRKHIEPIPGKFSSYEKAGDFWGRHDTTDYPEAFSEVEVEVDLKGRKFEIDIDADVMEMLRQRARKSHTRSGSLASRLLRKELAAV
jgi:predicted transcriptional regulator